MKRFLTILLALTLLCSCAAAQELKTPFQSVSMTITPPQNYEISPIDNDHMFIAVMRSKLLGALEYHIIVSKLDFEGMDTASLADLTDDQLASMAIYAAGEVETFEHGVYDLANGMKVMIIDEVGEADECALGYTLIDGYLIGVRADRCGTIGPLMDADYDRLLEVMGAITFEVAK